MEFDLAKELVRVTSLGFSPCIIYDDDGSFAVADEGFTTIRMSDEDDFKADLFGEASWFKPTPREAWESYLSRMRKYGNDV